MKRSKGRPIILFIAISDKRQIIGTSTELSGYFQCTPAYITILVSRGNGIERNGEVFYFDQLLQ